MSSPSAARRPEGLPARVVIIGIDGATFDVIGPLARAGRLPHLGRLMAEGCWGPLRSTIPPVTAPAWTSFMTGVNPGRHGIYDFRYRAAGSYDLLTNNTTTNQAPMLWEALSHHGKRCCVLNVPATYPPRPLDGELVTGLLTPADADIFTYPAELTSEIMQAIPGYTVWPASVFHPKGRERSFLDALDGLAGMGGDFWRFMQPRGPWDFSMLVFMGADQVQHAMWHYRDATHRDFERSAPAEFRDAIDTVYCRIDAVIGEMLAGLDRDTTVLVMSDHGFGPLEDWFHVNLWLIEQGLMVLKPAALSRLKALFFRLGLTPLNLYRLSLGLKLGKAVAQTTRHRRAWAFDMLRRFFVSFDDVDWSRTLAYSLGNVGPIYLNLAGREPQGIVAPEAYDRTLEEIEGRLRATRNPCTGEPLVAQIYRGRELYSGGSAGAGPDLLVSLLDGRIDAYGNTEFPANRWLTPTFGRSGSHRMDGVFIAHGPGIRTGAAVPGSRLWDIYPTVMALMGLPVPAGLDGQVLRPFLTEEVLAGVREDTRPAEAFGTGGAAGYSAAEEALVAERLKGLGYV